MSGERRKSVSSNQTQSRETETRVMVSFNLSVYLCCLATVAALKFTHLTGRFGDQRVPLDITFGQDIMEVSTYKPENAQSSFRPTSNLHIFKTKIVAIRNWMDKICYIQHFNATEEEMKERVHNAIQHEKDLGYVKEERISLKGLRPLLQRSVKRILGDEIAEFCHMHQVYILGHSNYHLLRPQDVQTNSRVKRYIWDPPSNGYRHRIRQADVIGDPFNGPRDPFKDIGTVC